MSDPTRATICGHEGHHGKGLCRLCYYRAYRAANREKLNAGARARRAASGDSGVRATERAWRAANAERLRVVKADWYRANAERVLKRESERKRWQLPEEKAKRRAWREANAEYLREYKRQQFARTKEQRVAAMRRWRLANPDAVAVLKNRRRARLVTGSDLTSAQWKAILAEFDGHCAYCQRTDLPLVLEHMTPLSRGGRHTESNVVPACGPCNQRKLTRTALEFAGQTGT